VSAIGLACLHTACMKQQIVEHGLIPDLRSTRAMAAAHSVVIHTTREFHTQSV